ncbi:MAG: hypothetical protein WBG16_18365, partial [Bradyrhizobium sp.]|uniref:hypothetical protein n=1 Tax=Bradyrhizobium sp. TaxID=376 RepID=UPI003BC7ABA4
FPMRSDLSHKGRGEPSLPAKRLNQHLALGLSTKSEWMKNETPKRYFGVSHFASSVIPSVEGQVR